jgi:hypothetical protein
MERSVARGHRERLWLKVLNDMQIARFIQFGVNGKNAMCCTNRLGDLCLLLSQALYIRDEAGTQRYNVGTDTPKLCATSYGGVPLANSFLAA